MPNKDLHEVNRLAWNEATVAHNSHKHDQAAFFRDGGSTLFPDEVELLGNIEGMSLAHLQCNAGQDSLSLARLGAAVTGVDISDTAIKFARTLSNESGIPAAFQRADVYDWLERASQGDKRYDIVFSSYGVNVWLSDIEAWVQGIASVLKPGGRFVYVEFHPILGVFEDGWKPTYDYMGGKSIEFEVGVGDYVAMSSEAITPSGYLEGVKDFQNPHPSYEFSWGVGEIVTATLDAGLQLTTLREYPYTNGFKRFTDMRELPGNRFTMPEGMPNFPLMMGLVAQKPAT